MMEDGKRTFLFEVSWEVCNKVGGIFEVVASKALQAVELYGDDYFLLGPDLRRNAGFVETDEPCWDALRHPLQDKNLKCRFGRWDIPGRPRVILVDFTNTYNSNQLLHQLWERYGVDSLSGGWDYIEPVLFSHACGEVIATACQVLALPERHRAVAQFHEWMCGAGLLAVKHLCPEVGTVFTTHATMLGRAMAGAGVDIYAKMGAISPTREAAAYNITPKYSMESISAREADVFTTVSRITADEATAFLGRVPDVVTTNGLDLRTIPDYSADRATAQSHRERVLEAVSRLLRRTLHPNTRIMAISGRYEYHNKGVDAFLEALAGAQQALQNSETHILALLLVMGGHSGVNQAAVSGDPNVVSDPSMPGAGFITSHHVYDAANDPILNACRRLGLHNREENHVQVVFVPALLDGNDGFFNMPYFDILAGCDLGVFPSWYEPWGYTPHESAAYGVPTVTTDLSGFGIWAREQESQQGDTDGVTVVSRRMAGYGEVVDSLRQALLTCATQPTAELDAQRRAVRALAGHASWADFFPLYTEAYSKALEKASQRGSYLIGARRREALNRALRVKSSTTPFLRTLMAVAELPSALNRLRELAYNLWWCWHPEAVSLFRDLNPEAWDACNHNPVRMIEEANAEILTALARDKAYLERYTRVMADFDAYMAAPGPDIPDEASPRGGLDAQHPVAYFSTEYGLHESLPLYSGGLGVLSGDHLKSASDENVPLVAVGLLYRNGYFQQALDKNGRQVALYPENDFSTLPIEPVPGGRGTLEISLELSGRTLYAQVWRCRVGRISLYLLDCNIPQNTEDDRRITARLYEADRDLRLRQEILLGVGGVRLLRTLGLNPAVYHMNEGHSAFLVLELIRHHMRDENLSLDEAMMLTRGMCAFTTHTPVDAGNERFSVELMERYFRSYAQSVGLEWQDFLRLGQHESGDARHFDMTALALRLSFKANAVSRLHGFVSRRMWRGLWRGVALAEVPIGYVTNGVHTASVAGPAFRALLDKAVGPDWLELPPDAPAWNKVNDIPDDEFWQARRTQKQALLDQLRVWTQNSAVATNVNRDQAKHWMDRLTPDTLVIGFARRFAPYKRATMLFADPDRLARLLDQAGQPVVLVFAGKAHPADEKGIDLIQEVVHHSLDPRFFGRIFFVENYSLAISRLLVQGCDVWLNTPRRPYEASGTSGQKVPVNGGINLSISDGWWVEGADGSNGWTIGPVTLNDELKDEQSDYSDAESLYSLLEDQVIPRYFDRDSHGLPKRWIATAKNSLRTLTAMYGSGRMVREYVKDIYLPTARRGAELAADGQALARRLGAWRTSVDGRFRAVRLEEIHMDGLAGDVLICGKELRVSVRLDSGDLLPDELCVQLVIGPTDGTDFSEHPTVVELKPENTAATSQIRTWTGSYTATRNGHYAYGVRVLPWTEGLTNPLRHNMILWG
ncbi:MAG: alpha-glucan family phosphorylase [Desulfovibrionaceae bacterium]|nr:alpha-glucan family phosphorylase [Desulfovibrionaceae bacterium]